MLINFTPEEPAYNFNQFYAATSTRISPRPIENPTNIPLVGKVPGNVTGPVVGGNLTSFLGGLGTPFEIDTRGKILLLEETHEPVNTVYRYMKNLEQAGKFRDCIGIIIGECTQCPPAYGVTFTDLVNEFVVPLGKPLLTNLATAHGTYKAAIPIGSIMNLNTIEPAITILEPAVSL